MTRVTLRPGRDSLPAFVGALPALALFIGWAADDGGYEPTTWYVGALALLFALVSIVAGLGSRFGRLPRSLLLALAALAAYALWSYASIAWADVRGEALEGANRTLLYLLIALVFASLPWTLAALRLALLTFVAAAGVLAVVTVVRVDAAGDPLDLFTNARLAAPLGYQNASPTMWTLVALPALVFASLRSTPWWLRGLLLGFCAVFVELALVSQSRTWLITLPVLFLVALALTPSRLRLLAAAAPVALATALAAPELLEVYNQGGSGSDDFRKDDEIARVIASAFDGAARAMYFSALAVAIAGAAWALLDGRREISERASRQLQRAGLGLAVVLAAGAVASAVALAPRIGDAWDEFTAGADPTEAGGSRFGSLGSSRADFWRVGWQIFKDNPVAGLGQDNFSYEYLERANSSEQPRWTHSLELRLLVHTGLVGFLLFALFAAGLIAALWAARRSVGPPGHAVLAAAVLPFAVWLLAGSVDWFWEMPALTGPAIGFAVAAAALAPGARSRGPGAARGLAGAGIVAALAAFLVLGAPWLAERHTARGLAVLPDVPQSLRHLDAAADLNPWTTRPVLTEGFIAVRQRRYDDARASFLEVLDRHGANWLAELELGALAAEAGNDREALRRLVRAAQLNPQEGIVREALRRARTGEEISIQDINIDLTSAERRLTAR